MNKQFLKVGLVALVASIYSNGASADVISGNAAAKVIIPLELIEVTAMNFGTVAPDKLAATSVTLTPGLGRTGTATLLAGPTVASLGKFTIKGDLSQTFNIAISVTGGAPNVLLSDGAGNTMTLTALTEDSDPLGALSGGADAFDIGGTLNLGINQAAGVYSTASGGGVTFDVTANYN